jgi:glycosyltransferase involved in cell wall biosynthesis
LPDDPDVRAVPKSSDPTKIVNLYCAADAYLHPAVADTHPLTVLEAMACGTPVAAYAVGGIPEQVDDGRTGILVPAGDAQGMAEALSVFLNAPDRAAAVGKEARRQAERRFGQAQMIAAYASWLEA